MANLAAGVENLSISEGPSRGHVSTFRFPPAELSVLNRHPVLFEREKANLQRIPLSIDHIKHNDRLVQIYTGMSTAQDFMNTLSMFSKMNINYHLGWVVGQLEVKDQLFMTFMKLKMNVGDKDLGHRFKCSLDVVTNSVLTWLYALHEVLYESSMEIFKNTVLPPPGSAYANPNPRLILGFVNVYGEIPRNVRKMVMGAPKEPYRGLLCLNLDGVVCFAGSLYTWFSSEKSIIYDCGVLDLVESGDMVVSDEVFQVEDLNPDAPTFNSCDEVSTSSDTIDEFVSAKMDMREVLKRIRQFEVIKCIPTELLQHASTVWQVCAILSNWLQY